MVDDVAENRDLLIRRLSRLGFSDIDQAENGVQALAAIEVKTYDLVLLDIMMPELDGFGVLEALKANKRIDRLPVIVISALSEIDPVVRCIELGAADFILKPFNPVLLRARVLTTLEKKAMIDRTHEELRRKQMELNEARTLQLALLPPPLAGTFAGTPLTIDVVLEPAKEVGGDLVDHFQVGDDLVVIVLGDVSDKGAGAALMMARTHALVRGLASRPDAAELFRAPERAADLVNAALATGNDGCMFVTFFMASLDLASPGNKLAYVRAGHIPPFHYGAGSSTRLDHLSGPPLGLDEDVRYSRGMTTFSDGDRLLAYTDGVSEAHNPAGVLYGEADVARFIANPEYLPLRNLIDRVRAFEAGRAAYDDVAAILLYRGVAGPPKFSRHIQVTPQSISTLTEDIMGFLSAEHVDPRATHHVALGIDEILMNLMTHAAQLDRPAEITVGVAPGKVTATVVDSAAPFDPRTAQINKTAQTAEDTLISGRGLLLLKSFSSELDYQSQDGTNRLTFAIARA